MRLAPYTFANISYARNIRPQAFIRLFASLTAALGISVMVPKVASAESYPKAKAHTITVRDAESGRPLGRVILKIAVAGDSETIKIAGPNQLKAKALYLSNPPRIMIDIADIKAQRSETVKIVGYQTLTALRIGVHSDKLRIVADLMHESEGRFSFSSGGKEALVRIAGRPTTARTPTIPTAVANTPVPTAISIGEPTTSPKATFTEAPTSEQTTKPTTEPTIQPTIQPTTEPSITHTATPSATASITNTPTYTPTSAAKKQPTAAPTATWPPPTPAQASSKSLPTTSSPLTSSGSGAIPVSIFLTSYRFDYLEPGKVPVLKIILSRARANAKIGKIGPSEYKIIIPAGGLANKSLDLPQFPPADFLGFVMVTAKALENRLEITINVEQGVTLGTFVKNNEIWVKRLQ